MLEINDLHVTVDGKKILKGLTLALGEGEVHAIMGPNGSGKSTLSYVLAGRDGYEVTQGIDDVSRAKPARAEGRRARGGGNVPGDAVSGRNSGRDHDQFPAHGFERAAQGARRSRKSTR